MEGKKYIFWGYYSQCRDNTFKILSRNNIFLQIKSMQIFPPHTLTMRNDSFENHLTRKLSFTLQPSQREFSLFRFLSLLVLTKRRSILIMSNTISYHLITSIHVQCYNGFFFFSFSLQEVGSIIGKKGEIVKRFREEVSYCSKNKNKYVKRNNKIITEDVH